MSPLVFDTRVSLSEDMSAVGFYAMALHDEILHPIVYGLSSSPESPSSLALGPQEHLVYSSPLYLPGELSLLCPPSGRTWSSHVDII